MSAGGVVLTVLVVAGLAAAGGGTATAAASRSVKPPAACGAHGALPHISGLSTSQVGNARAIVAEGRQMHIPQRGQVIAIATALQESGLHNYSHASDHDSLGLFQQRPSTGWGTPAQVTNPCHAAHSFYTALNKHKSLWSCLTCAAQAVQRSAYPRAYAPHETQARRIVTALNR